MIERFKISILDEPKIEFGEDFVCDDPKMGIAIGGFFSKSNNSHKSQINIALISTEKLIVETLEWMKNFENRIVAKEATLTEKYSGVEDGEIKDEFDDFSGFDTEDIQIFQQLEATKVTNKKYNPDFLGFNQNSIYNCIFQNNEGNNRDIKPRELNKILEDTELSELDKLDKIIELFKKKFEDMLVNKFSDIDVCYIVIPTEIFKSLHSVKFGKSYVNLRRKLKAELIAIDNTIPTQIIVEATIKGTKKSMQDMSMTAWNFCTASYYKSGCIPWALQVKDVDTCFIGISFNKIVSERNNLVRSSIAQAFNREGQGLVFTWKNFLWDDEKNKTKAPHLEYAYAKEMIQYVLEEYQKANHHTPSRVVIHKTTDFWDSKENENYNELDGFRDGIIKKLGDDTKIDFVAIKSSPVKILRNFGKFPVVVES